MYAYADPALSTVLEVGETSLPRRGIGTTGAAGALVSGNLYLMYFTAQKTELINNLSIIVAGTATGTTYCAMGVYDLLRTRTAYTGYTTYLGDPKLSYWTTNDTTIGNGIQRYTKSLNGSWYKEKGMRYALGILWAGSTGFQCVGEPVLNSTVAGLYMTSQPILAHVVTGQTQLWPGGLLGGSRLPSNSRTLGSATYTTTNGGTAVTLAITQGPYTNPQTGFLPDEVGLPISGTNIPSGAYIAAWNNFSSIALSAAATGTGSGISGAGITIGPASFSSTTAPRRLYFEMTP